MKRGATISAGLHLSVIGLALWGGYLFPARETPALVFTEIEMVDAAELDAALSTAPVVPTEGPSEMSAPETQDSAEVDPDAADAEVAALDAPPLSTDVDAPDQPAARPEIVLPPRVNAVPTEAPRMTIAEIPSPDLMPIQAAVPESKPSTEPLQPLASAPTPLLSPSPKAPPLSAPDPLAAAQKEKEPEEKPDPESLAEAQPDAPLGPAPREARLPVAKPAELAAAAQATGPTQAPARETEEKPAEEPKTARADPEPEPKAKAKEPAASGGSTSQFANIVTRGEKDALSLGIKRYFTYNGNRSDPSLQVTLRIGLDRSGKITAGPELLRAQGGDKASQGALYQAGRRALLRAMNGGEFRKLPADKYEGWQLIHVTFTPEEIGFSS